MPQPINDIFREYRTELKLIIDDLRHNLKDCKRTHQSIVNKKRKTKTTLGVVRVPGGDYGNNVFDDPRHLTQNDDGSYTYPTLDPFDDNSNNGG